MLSDVGTMILTCVSVAVVMGAGLTRPSLPSKIVGRRCDHGCDERGDSYRTATRRWRALLNLNRDLNSDLNSDLTGRPRQASASQDVGMDMANGLTRI